MNQTPHTTSSMAMPEENLEQMPTIIEITSNQTEMDAVIDMIKETIDKFYIPSVFDRTFVYSILESDIRGNIRIFKTLTDNTDLDSPYEDFNYLIQVDEYNGLYLPMDVFINTVVPSYLSIQLRTAFSELTTIRDVLNDIASTIQDEIERLTIAASEEEFKEAKFNKKDISSEDLNNILTKHTTVTKISNHLDECPLCGIEKISHYYECSLCKYTFCSQCCEEIASRQALCPCCRNDLTLIEHKPE